MPYFRDRSPLWWLDRIWWDWIAPLLLVGGVVFVVFVVLMRVKGLW